MTDTTNEEVLDEITPFTDEADREIAYRAEGTPSSATPGERPAVIAPGAATGRRKEAIARVRLVPGTGQFKINGRTLEVKVPRGIRPGQVIRLAGQGEAGGNLLLEVEYATDARFEVDGRNILYALEVAPWEAALGASVSVPEYDRCSVDRPMSCGGSTSTGNDCGSCARAASSTPCSSSASTFSGRCGPCCSMAVTGSTATVRAARPASRAAANSRVESSAQKRLE